MIQANMTSEQLEAYTLHLRIEEISQKIRINDVIPGDGDRYVCYNRLEAMSNQLTGLLRRHHSTTILVVVSILASFVIESALKTSATSSLRRP